jgi:hypothetical protein
MMANEEFSAQVGSEDAKEAFMAFPKKRRLPVEFRQ